LQERDVVAQQNRHRSYVERRGALELFLAGETRVKLPDGTLKKISDPHGTTLVLGGLNSVGSCPVSFTLPLEGNYTKLLDKSDGSAPGGSTVP
jgi:hypothetical protein